MIAGIPGMLVLPADSLDSPPMARYFYVSLIPSSDHTLNGKKTVNLNVDRHPLITNEYDYTKPLQNQAGNKQ